MRTNVKRAATWLPFLSAGRHEWRLYEEIIR